ncbi:MAG: CdaR family protein [Myxococcota bacterium]
MPEPEALPPVRRAARSLLRASVANPWTKIMSLLLALATWLYVQGEDGRVERVQAQIAWNRPDDLVATEALPVSAMITVRGTRSAVNKAHQIPMRLVVDITTLDKGEHEVDLTSIPVEGLPPSVERLAITPSTVRFELEKVATHSVRVDPILVGEPAEGYAVARALTDPQVVEVRGPTGAVASLRQVPTRPIDVSKIDRTVERTVDLDLPRGVELSGAPVIRATVEVVSRNDQRRMDAVPVYVKASQEGWRVSPDRIAVVLEGPTDELRAVQPGQLAAYVHLPDQAERGGQTLELSFGRGPGPRVEVLVGDTSVRAVAIEPATVTATHD